MNHNRLFVLSSLAARGPMHGHGIRRQAQEDRTELWSDVRPGSLYPALHRLEAEGLIQPLRTEQAGKRPARTVYEITDEGRRELRVLWEEAFDEQLLPEAIDLAIYNADQFPLSRVRARLEDRRTIISGELQMFERLYETAEPHLSMWERAGFRHRQMRLATELRWIDDLLEAVRARGSDDA